MSVELGTAESYEEQIDEISRMRDLMSEHLGDDYVLVGGNTDEWTPEYHMENRRPLANCEEGSYRNQVIFDYADLGVEEAYSAAQAMAEEAGLSPSITDDGAGDERMYFAGSGPSRSSLVVRESQSESGGIEVLINTACSDHESMHEAYDRIVGEQVEQNREERRQDREERLEQYD